MQWAKSDLRLLGQLLADDADGMAGLDLAAYEEPSDVAELLRDRPAARVSIRIADLRGMAPRALAR